MKKFIIMSVFGIVLSLTSNQAEAAYRGGRRCCERGPRMEVGVGFYGGRHYCGHERRREWMEGRWSCGRHGRRVWVPGYWTVI